MLDERHFLSLGAGFRTRRRIKALNPFNEKGPTSEAGSYMLNTPPLSDRFFLDVPSEEQVAHSPIG